MKLVARVPLEELRAGGMKRVSYPPYDVLVALVDGQPYALEDACNHAGASLSEGDIEGSCVSCPQHGYLFELSTGKLVAPKGLCDDQRTFSAIVEGTDVVIYDPFVLSIR